MPSLQSYRKVTDKYTTYELLSPDSGQDDDAARVAELATIDGRTYVMVPDGAALPEQPNEVNKTLKEVTLDGWLVTQLTKASPQLKLTKERISGKKSKVRYSKQDKNQLNLMAVFFDPAELAAHVDNFRKWDKK